MVNRLKGIYINTLINLRGWRTSRKIIVFDSDDWGSIRMPDASTYKRLLMKGIRVDNCPYNRYDSLASEDDLTSLFEVLDGFRDISGRPPVFTTNIVPANPDFKKIRESGFGEYHYELFTETLKRYPNHSKSFQIWKEGIDNRLFHPQFHGREHLNVTRWMYALRQGLPETRLAFDSGMFGISTTITSEKRKSYLAAFEVCEEHDIEYVKNIIADGLKLFGSLFGYSPESFIAPNYIWPSQIEQFLSGFNVRYLKGLSMQFCPARGTDVHEKVRHYTGQINLHNQIHLVRNCRFEPTLDKNKNSTDECLAQIRNSFRLGRPAIISSHRVNYIGSIDPTNREKNLIRLRALVTMIQKKWPDCEFMTADQVGDLIYNKG